MSVSVTAQCPSVVRPTICPVDSQLPVCMYNCFQMLVICRFHWLLEPDRFNRQWMSIGKCHWRPHSAHRGKWSQLTPWKNGWKMKKRKHAKRAVFYVYIIFWEQSRQAGVENGAMLTTLFIQIYFKTHHFVVKLSQFSSPQAARGIDPLTKILRTFLCNCIYSRAWTVRKLPESTFVLPLIRNQTFAAGTNFEVP